MKTNFQEIKKDEPEMNPQERLALIFGPSSSYLFQDMPIDIYEENKEKFGNESKNTKNGNMGNLESDRISRIQGNVGIEGSYRVGADESRKDESRIESIEQKSIGKEEIGNNKSGKDRIEANVNLTNVHIRLERKNVHERILPGQKKSSLTSLVIKSKPQNSYRKVSADDKEEIPWEITSSILFGPEGVYSTSTPLRTPALENTVISGSLDIQGASVYNYVIPISEAKSHTDSGDVTSKTTAIQSDKSVISENVQVSTDDSEIDQIENTFGDKIANNPKVSIGSFGSFGKIVLMAANPHSSSQTMDQPLSDITNKRRTKAKSKHNGNTNSIGKAKTISPFGQNENIDFFRQQSVVVNPLVLSEKSETPNRNQASEELHNDNEPSESHKVKNKTKVRQGKNSKIRVLRKTDPHPQSPSLSIVLASVSANNEIALVSHGSDETEKSSEKGIPKISGLFSLLPKNPTPQQILKLHEKFLLRCIPGPDPLDLLGAKYRSATPKLT